jgi:hypothetical protein
MAAKDKPKATKKKSYKKPTADKLNDKDLNRVTGGAEEVVGFPVICRVGAAAIRCRPVGAGVAAGSCMPAGGAATLSCTAGGAATTGCTAGGAVARSCTPGGTDK